MEAEETHVREAADVMENLCIAAEEEKEDVYKSKNVARKQRRWEKQVAAKKSRRKEEKQRRKMLRLQDAGQGAEPQLSKRVMKAIVNERLEEARCGGIRVCVDLSMSDCMSDKEVSRLAAQLRRLYGSNRKSTRPFHVFLSDMRLDGRLQRECVRMNDGFLRYKMEVREESFLDLFPPAALVYLTPDADQALDSLEADKVYVLGGLVDESIQKKLSLSRAAALSLRTARLPIDEVMVKRSNAKNFHSKILAINQVFDILLTFRDTGSWSAALQAWFPPGKGYVVAPDASPPPHANEGSAHRTSPDGGRRLDSSVLR